MAELVSCAHAHAKCFHEFESLIRALKQPANDSHTLISPADILNEFDRYKIWAGNVGAAHSGKRYEISLDYRLREASSLKNHVLKLLSTLEGRLCRANNLISGRKSPAEELVEDSNSDGSTSSDLEEDTEEERTDFEDAAKDTSTTSSHEDGSSLENRLILQTSAQPPYEGVQRFSAGPVPRTATEPLSEISRILESVKFTVTCLYRAPIRSPAPLDRIKHRDALDMAGYQHFDVLYVKDKFPDLRPQAATRLGKMITRRRHILRYRDAHNERLDIARVQPTLPVNTEDNATASAYAQGSQVAPKLPVRSQAASSHFTVHSKATTARPGQSTFLTPQEDLDTQSASSTTESGLSMASSYANRHLRIRIPSRPKDENGEALESFECPYCLLTKNIFTNRKWKKHVLQDLQPYVCTYEDCELYDKFFENRDAWFRHEAQHHRIKWSCNDDRHTEYDSVKDFMAHMGQDHNRNFNEEQLSLLTSMFRRPTKSLKGLCNLCHHRSDNLKTHVARHLEQIATFALPRVNETVGSGQAERRSTSSKCEKASKYNKGSPNDSDDEFLETNSSRISSVVSGHHPTQTKLDFDEVNVSSNFDEGESIPEAMEDQNWDSVTKKFSEARTRSFRTLRVSIYDENQERRLKLAAIIDRLQCEPRVVTRKSELLSAGGSAVRKYSTEDVILIGEISESETADMLVRQIRTITDAPIMIMSEPSSNLDSLSDVSKWRALEEPRQSIVEEALESLCQWAAPPPYWRREHATITTPQLKIRDSLDLNELSTIEEAPADKAPWKEIWEPNLSSSSSVSDSPIVYSESSEEDDSDDSRPYTKSMTLTTQAPPLQRQLSVVSDGGEQTNLDSSQSYGQEPHSSGNAVQTVPGVKSSRYALQKMIYSTLVHARSDDATLPIQRFFPKDQLNNVITPASVFAELFRSFHGICSEAEIQEYANTICANTRSYVQGRLRQKSYRSIFTILVLIDKSNLILQFIQENVSDLELPLVPVNDSEGISGMRRRVSGLHENPQPLLACFGDEEWSPSHRDQFNRYQWYMLAPFFSKGKYGEINHYSLQDQHILPFVSWIQAKDDAAGREGGYGRVFMVRIHPAHHKLGEVKSSDRGFAVKQMLASDRKSFKREKDMLRRFSGKNRHPHIVSLLATYRHRSKYHFIFDRAQGNLMDFFNKDERPPKSSHSDIVWISEQCSGIADGLLRIHRHKVFKVGYAQRRPAEDDRTAPKGQIASDEKVDGRIAENPARYRAPSAKHAVSEANEISSSEDGLQEHYEIVYGRHGDINPSNILWFPNWQGDMEEPTQDGRGSLKIADFGLMEVNSALDKSGPRDVAHTTTYRPPECDAADRTIRQSYDIWCLGCVILELATWMLGGAPLVEQFVWSRLSRDPAYGNIETDTYFELVWNHDTRKTEARVKPSVLEVLMPHPCQVLLILNRHFSSLSNCIAREVAPSSCISFWI